MQSLLLPDLLTIVASPDGARVETTASRDLGGGVLRSDWFLEGELVFFVSRVVVGGMVGQMIC